MMYFSEFKNAPEGLVRMWDKIYDSVLKQYNDKERAAQTAWAAVKKKYKKDADSGQWVQKENRIIKLANDLIEALD